MALHVVAIFSIMPAKTLIFLWPKIRIQILVKNAHFSAVFES